jgi:tetratricopeptide (TPR) repeat protein
VSGLVTIGDELVADRYSYLSTLSLFVLLGGAVSWLWGVRLAGVLRYLFRLAIVAISIGLVGACGYHARRILPIWHDSLSLWGYAVEQRPASYKAWNNLGGALVKARRFGEAEHACREALKRRPDYATGYYNLGVALSRQVRPAEAAEAYANAIRLDPTNARAHANLGTALIWLDKPAEAIEALNRALQLDAHSVPNAYFQRGEAHRKLGQYDASVENYLAAIRMNPRQLGPHAALADVYLSLERIDEAESAALQAVVLRPDRPEGHYALAQVRAKQRRLAEALQELRRALASLQFFRDRARTDPHLRELRLDPRFGRMMRQLPATKPAERSYDGAGQSIGTGPVPTPSRMVAMCT